MESLSEDEKFSLIYMNCGILCGPKLNDGKFFSSDFLKNVVMGTFRGLPDITIPLVDVRDVANIFLAALSNEEANNKRFLLAATDLSLD